MAPDGWVARPGAGAVPDAPTARPREAAAGPDVSTRRPACSRRWSARPAVARDPSRPDHVRSDGRLPGTACPRRHRTTAPMVRCAPAAVPVARRHRPRRWAAGVRCRRPGPDGDHPGIATLPPAAAAPPRLAGDRAGPACHEGRQATADHLEEARRPDGAVPRPGEAGPGALAGRRTEGRRGFDHHAGAAASVGHHAGRHARRSRVEPPGPCVGGRPAMRWCRGAGASPGAGHGRGITRLLSSVVADGPRRCPARRTGRDDSSYMSCTPLRHRR